MNLNAESIGITFEFFRYFSSAVEAIDKGVIQISRDVSMLDLGILFTLDKIKENGMGEFTTEKVAKALPKFCGPIFATEEGYDKAASIKVSAVIERNRKKA
ncbi:MAG: hypothetical protein LIP12_10050 [Clostridiales bacterium]|nr:hypothetical protein [Clostridiales bacterium]